MGADPAAGAQEPAESAEDAMNARMVEQQIGFSMNSNRDRLSDNLGLTREQTAEVQKEHSSFLRDLVNVKDAGDVHQLIVSHMITPATEEQAAAWAIEARRAVREAYGNSRHNPDELFEQASQAVMKKPRLVALLNNTGLGNHPKVILSVIAGVLRKRGDRPL